MKKVISSVLVVLILLSMLSGCYKNADVLVIDGYPIYPGLYLYFQLQSLSMVSQQLGEDLSEKELLKLTYEDVPVNEWISSNIIDLAREFVFIEKAYEALEEDSELLDYEMAYYDSTLRQEWSNTQLFYTKNGIGYETFRKAYANYVKSTHLFNALYMTEGGEFAVTDDEVKEIFARDYTFLDDIRISIVDENKNPLDDAAIEEVRKDINLMKAVAEETVEEEGIMFLYPENIGLQAAFKYYCEIKGLTEEEIAEIKGKMFSEHTTVKSDSVLYEAGYKDEIFSCDFDKLLVYEGDNYIYLFCRRSILDFNEDAWKEYKANIVQELKGDPFKDYITEGSLLLPVTEKASARGYYNVKKARL